MNAAGWHIFNGKKKLIHPWHINVFNIVSLNQFSSVNWCNYALWTLCSKMQWNMYTWYIMCALWSQSIHGTFHFLQANLYRHYFFIICFLTVYLFFFILDILFASTSELTILALVAWQSKQPTSTFFMVTEKQSKGRQFRWCIWKVWKSQGYLPVVTKQQCEYHNAPTIMIKFIIIVDVLLWGKCGIICYKGFIRDYYHIIS